MTVSRILLLWFALILAAVGVVMLRNGQPLLVVLCSVVFLAACFGGLMRFFLSHRSNG